MKAILVRDPDVPLWIYRQIVVAGEITLLFFAERNCSDVVCPEEGIECPKDSYRLPNSRTPGDCCSHPQGCECLPRPCPEPECANDEHARMVRVGNQKPGTCCPLFECVKHGKS